MTLDHGETQQGSISDGSTMSAASLGLAIDNPDKRP